MRSNFVYSGGVLVLAGAGLLAALLYDATHIVRLMGLAPIGNEAIVVQAGLVLVALSVTAGVRMVRRARFLRTPAADRI